METGIVYSRDFYRLSMLWRVIGARHLHGGSCRFLWLEFEGVQGRSSTWVPSRNSLFYLGITKYNQLTMAKQRCK